MKPSNISHPKGWEWQCRNVLYAGCSVLSQMLCLPYWSWVQWGTLLVNFLPLYQRSGSGSHSRRTPTHISISQVMLFLKFFFKFYRTLPFLQNFLSQWKPVRQLQRRPSQRPGKKCLSEYLLCSVVSVAWADALYFLILLPWPRRSQHKKTSSVSLGQKLSFGGARRNMMKYGDLHLKDNEKLHSCFPCLGIGSGAFREETTAGFKYC